MSNSCLHENLFLVLMLLILQLFMRCYSDCNSLLCHLGPEVIQEQPVSASETQDVELPLPIEERPVRDTTAPIFTKKLEDLVVDAGEEARFDVRIFAVPEPQVEWYRGSEKVLDEGRFVHIDAIEDELFTLIIEQSEVRDVGQYKVVASNEAGQASCEAQLTVKGKQAAPEGPEEPETSVLDVDEGGEVNLNVTVSGTAKPTVEWLKDGKPVRKTSRLDTKVKGDTYTLNIKEAEPNDSGIYTFKATSPAGTTTKNFDVNVQGMLSVVIRGVLTTQRKAETQLREFYDCSGWANQDLVQLIASLVGIV